MIADTLIALILCSTAWYGWFILRAYRGLRMSAEPDASRVQPSVSVVVAARNEEVDLPGCLEALSGQKYPGGTLEFIVVDDGSEDGTADLVRRHAEGDRRFTLLRLDKEATMRPSRKRGRKPEALAAGIARAKGDVIAITDADCRPDAGWIRSLTRAMQEDVVYAVGPVVERDRGTVFSKVRSLEILGLTGMAGGRIGIGSPLNSLGGNLAFRKEAYLQTRGFDYEEVKSDEETMMHRILSRRLGRVVFVPDRHARVVTTSPSDLAGFWNQRKRWGSMHGRFNGKTILAELLAVYVSLLVPIVALLMVPMVPSIGAWVGGFFLFKALVDWLMLRTCAQLFGDPVSVPVFLLAESFHTFYLVVVSAVAQFTRYSWKDRTVLTFETAQTES